MEEAGEERALKRLHCRGTSLIRNTPPPQGHYIALGKVLLQGPRRWSFLMSEVPL